MLVAMAHLEVFETLNVHTWNTHTRTLITLNLAARPTDTISKKFGGTDLIQLSEVALSHDES
jgi:hypothetical protein